MNRRPQLMFLSIFACAVFGALLLLAADPDSETWRFDRLDQISGHAATILGHPRVIDTSIGKALLFNGEDDAVQVDVHPLAGAAAFTWEVIFRPDAGGGAEQRFFHLQESDAASGKDSATRMLFELRLIDGRFCMEGVAFSGTESKALIDREKLHPLGRWYHGALVYDGRELRTYVDGVAEGAGLVHLDPQGAGHSSIGARIDRRSYFKGAIFEARMTRRALAPSEFLSVPRFREHTVATGLEGGYQVVAAGPESRRPARSDRPQHARE